MNTMASKVFLASGGTFHRALIFMLKLGWQSRFRIPMLLIMLIVAMDNRLQLEVVELRSTEQHNHL
ncbi:hypothetical protein WN55_09228 [Dufourea novaeangliae]|uniref:Uncharacterized protein n=1 Tax=Dufourea novaeangliae TaxID=178035 RepID=A0A154PAC8_DUFNO|nr:hypothetical protein WN55_09228 [Dufourea novaeangliae]